MRLPTFPRGRLVQRRPKAEALSSTLVSTFPTLSITSAVSAPFSTATAPTYADIDTDPEDALSDWDSEDDEDLTWDEAIDGPHAEFDCDSDSDDQDEHKHLPPMPPFDGGLHPAPTAINGTTTTTIATASGTGIPIVLPTTSSSILSSISSSSLFTSSSSSSFATSTRRATTTSALFTATPLLSNSITTFVPTTTTGSTLAAGNGDLFAMAPTTALAGATSSTAASSDPGFSNTATAAGIAVGATAGLVFIASAAFIIMRMRLKRNPPSTPSTPSVSPFSSRVPTARGANHSPPPSPNPFNMPPGRRILTNSELLDNFIAAAYAHERKPNRANPDMRIVSPPATLPAPAGAVYGYGYDDVESEVDTYGESIGGSRDEGMAATRSIVEPSGIPAVTVSNEAGDRNTVMMWMGGMKFAGPLYPPPTTPLPMTPGAAAPIGLGGFGVVGKGVADSASYYGSDIRIPSAYGPDPRESSLYQGEGMSVSGRPESPWDYENYRGPGATRLQAPPGAYM